jgi:hypothetical protein
MLTQSKIDDYRRDGYTIHPALLGADDVALMLSELDRICAGNTLAAHDSEKMEMEPGQPPAAAAVRRVYEPCSYYPAFADLSESAAHLDHQLSRCRCLSDLPRRRNGRFGAL